MGCSECSLLKQLKFHLEIELLAGVDIDGAILKKKMYVYELKGPSDCFAIHIVRAVEITKSFGVS